MISGEIKQQCWLRMFTISKKKCGNFGWTVNGKAILVLPRQENFQNKQKDLDVVKNNTSQTRLCKLHKCELHKGYVPILNGIFHFGCFAHQLNKPQTNRFPCGNGKPPEFVIGIDQLTRFVQSVFIFYYALSFQLVTIHCNQYGATP